MERFEGLIAAPFAPMSVNGEVMYDRIESYYDLLEKNKVVGAFINGKWKDKSSATTFRYVSFIIPSTYT